MKVEINDPARAPKAVSVNRVSRVRRACFRFFRASLKRDFPNKDNTMIVNRTNNECTIIYDSDPWSGGVRLMPSPKTIN